MELVSPDSEKLSSNNNTAGGGADRPDPRGRSTSSINSWRRSNSRLPGLRLANGRVGYRTVSEDYGPG